VYDDFVPKFVRIAKAYKLGDPTKQDTNLGPVVSLASAERIRKQVEDAGTPEPTWRSPVPHELCCKVRAGAKKLIAEGDFPVAQP